MTPKKASRRATAYSVGVLDAIFSIPPVKISNSANSRKSPQGQVQLRYKERNESALDEKDIRSSTYNDDSESSGVTVSTGRSRNRSFLSKIRSNSSSSTKSTKRQHSKGNPTHKEGVCRDKSHESDNDSVVSNAAEKHTKAASKLRKQSDRQRKNPKEATGQDKHDKSEAQTKKIHPLLHHPAIFPGTFRSLQQRHALNSGIPAVVPLSQFPVPHPAATAWAPPAPAAPYAEQLQRVQLRINETTAQLRGNPANKQLKDHLDTLQKQLNAVMNAAITGKLGKGDMPEPKPEQEEQATANAAATTTGNGEFNSDIQQDMGEKISLAHHLCSNCHKIRSAQYHRLHPLDDAQAPVHNLCEGCKDSKPDFLAQFHFCSGCGVVRSKAFHRKVCDGISPGEPNYCGKCVARVSKTKQVVESTVVNQSAHPLNDGSQSAIAVRFGDECPSQGGTLSDTGSAMVRQDHDAADSIASTNSNCSQNSIKSTSKSSSVLIDNEETPAPPSYYYPARAHSSDYRRAQRSEPSMMPDCSESTKKAPSYRAPYVRDDASEPLSPYSVETSQHSGPKTPRPLNGNATSFNNSNCSSGTASPIESYASSSDKSADICPDNAPKYWNGAFSRRHETTMFVNTDINYPPDFDAPMSSCRKSFYADGKCDQTRYSGGAFKDRSPLGSAGLSWASANGYHSPPQSPPWNPSDDTQTSNSHGQPAPTYKRQTSMFSNFIKPVRSADDFRKPSPTTSHFRCPSPFHRPKWHHNPEPIIEEPISPPPSPVQSPMLLEFNVSDSTDSE